MEILAEEAQSVAGQAMRTISKKSRESKVIPGGDENNSNIRPEIQTTPLRVKPNYLSGPFGGDSLASNSNPPPPIGFVTTISQDVSKRVAGQPTQGPPRADSDLVLYDGDMWSKLWFQRLMLLSLIRLVVGVRKIYEDYQSTKTYSASGQMGYLLVSVLTLFSPTIIFTTYRLCRYLQSSLEDLRLKTQTGICPYPTNSSSIEDGAKMNEAKTNKSKVEATDETEGLMSARQTPVPTTSGPDEVFYDSRSQQLDLSKATSPDPTGQVKFGQPAESVQIDKLGNLPDREATRIVIGSSEQLLHGVLFIFWQLKRQVDVIAYLVERSCLWRRPSKEEIYEIERLRTGSDGLEWFQDFYAAFLAILAQVYTLGLHWRGADMSHRGTMQQVPSTFDRAITGDTSDSIGISNAAKVVSETLSKQQVLGNIDKQEDLLILSELIVSSVVVVSLLIAVRRKDDGPLTLGLSMIGWGSLFAARIIIVALSFVHIGWKIMGAVVLLHCLGITSWIYKIAVDSHNGKSSELEALIYSRQIEDRKNNREREESLPSFVIKNWSIGEHLVLIVQIFNLFALPSLFYWPVMFNLRLHCRPLKYLLLVLIENSLLITTVWLTISPNATAGQWYLLCAVGGFSIVGFIFIFLYVSCKPTLTDYFARSDHLFNGAEQAGIYFEFCSRVFKMPDLSDPEFVRLTNQTEDMECGTEMKTVTSSG